MKTQSPSHGMALSIVLLQDIFLGSVCMAELLHISQFSFSLVSFLIY